MFKIQFQELTTVFIVLAFFSIGIAIIGTNPLSAPDVLDIWARVVLGVLGIVMIVFVIVQRRHRYSIHEDMISSDYQKRFQEAQAEFKKITPEEKFLGGIQLNEIKFDVINGNILDSRSEVIVSSDDNYFTARGGVAKVIMNMAGPEVLEELHRYRRKSYRQGHLVITTGGKWNCRAIIHPAVIDLDEDRFPNKEVVSKLVRRCLECAIIIGARSISFPVLGGGTGSKNLLPKDSVHSIASEVINYIKENDDRNSSLSHIVLYIYNKEDAEGLPEELLP